MYRRNVARNMISGVMENYAVRRMIFGAEKNFSGDEEIRRQEEVKPS